uniref:FTH domain-containing protein n=1 Tax=Caenorhabditis tropicalis TaxID=1561998 RepID=A0A1I7TAH4_9PELO
MNSKPLTYDSLKTVILYMEPNIRFLLASRIPSIRLTEKAVPLKIDELAFEFDSHNVKVNDTKYEYEVYQVDCKDKIPYRVSGKNELNWKMTCDVDEFGIRDYIIKAGGMLPENTKSTLFGYHNLGNISTNEGRLQKLKRILNHEKQRYDQLLSFRPEQNAIDHEDEMRNLSNFKRIFIRVPRSYYSDELELLKNEEMVKKAIEFIKEKIRKMENELLPFENKRNNIRPQFEIYLTKRSQRDSPPHLIEHVKYTGDLHRAEESLMNFMFSKRRHVVVINNLRITHLCPLRMSSDVKIRVRNLNIKRNLSSNLKLIKSIVDKSSLQLESLSIFIKLNRDRKLVNEFIDNSKHLTVAGAVDLPLMQRLQNHSVFFPMRSTVFLLGNDFIVLIRSWVETKKPIGTCFTFKSFEEGDETALQILDNIRNGIAHAALREKCVNIPMSTSAKLQISYSRSEHFVLLFKMTVVPID